MELNNDLITQFAKITKINTTGKDTTTVRGTIHISEDRVYIRLDGAAENSMTPAETTVEVNEGDRVIAAVKDHSIVITGNKTNPSIGKVTAGKLSSSIEQTAESITAKVTANYDDLNGKISDESTARANGDNGLSERIISAESTFTQRADQIQSTVKSNYDTLDGKISDESTARANGDNGLSERITSAESRITQTASEISSTVKSNYDALDGKISSEATARANGDSSLGTRITNAESKITQTASEISSTVTANYNTLDGKISSEATARANADTTNYNSLNGKISDEATARANGDNGLSERITSAESRITQTATEIRSEVTAKVETLEGNDERFTKFIQDMNSFTFMGNGGTVKITGGDINLTGALTWSDFDSDTQSAINGIADDALNVANGASSTASSAYALAQNAMNAANSLSLPSYITASKITKTEIESPTIIGGTFYAVGSDPDEDATFTTMDENGFYLYSNASKANIDNKIQPKISLYCDTSSTYINPMIVLGSGVAGGDQFHNRFVIEKRATAVSMDYIMTEGSNPGCGITFHSGGYISIDGGIDLFPVGTILLSDRLISPASYLSGEWERVEYPAFIYMTSADSKVGNYTQGGVVTAGGTNAATYLNVAAWHRVG